MTVSSAKSMTHKYNDVKLKISRRKMVTDYWKSSSRCILFVFIKM